jgi:hypothetical protein
MEFYRTALLAGSLILFSAPLLAQEQAVLGQGNVSCGSWTESRRGDDPQVAARTAWVLGYITAFNQYGSKPAGGVSGGIDTQEITAFVDSYCLQHQTNDLSSASAALVAEFRQRTGR